MSTTVETKLADFDNRLDNLDKMITLLEYKLNSLPDDVTSKYPPLSHCSLDDVNPEIMNLDMLNGHHGNGAAVYSKLETIKEEEDERPNNAAEDNNKVDDNNPETKLNRFLEDNEDLKIYYTMIKVGVPEGGVLQKAQREEFDLDKVQTMIDLYKLVYPNPILN